MQWMQQTLPLSSENKVESYNFFDSLNAMYAADFTTVQFTGLASDICSSIVRKKHSEIQIRSTCAHQNSTIGRYAQSANLKTYTRTIFTTQDSFFTSE